MSAFSLARLRCVRVSRYSFLVFWMKVSAGKGEGVGGQAAILMCRFVRAQTSAQMSGRLLHWQAASNQAGSTAPLLVLLLT